MGNPTRNVILQMNVSLDGITSGPNGEMEWMLVEATPYPLGTVFLRYGRG